MFGSIYSTVNFMVMDESENVSYCIICGTNKKDCQEVWGLHIKKHDVLKYMMAIMALTEKADLEDLTEL